MFVGLQYHTQTNGQHLEQSIATRVDLGRVVYPGHTAFNATKNTHSTQRQRFDQYFHDVCIRFAGIAPWALLGLPASVCFVMS